MALFGRDEKDAPPPQQPPMRPLTPQPAEPPRVQPLTPPAPLMHDRPTETAEFGEVSAYLGKGSRVSGKLFFDGTVRVDGQVEGEISAQETLIVGEKAVVTAQISGTTVIIKGKVTGDINARKRVEIRAPGKLYGNIVTPSLVIHEGVLFEGHCSMGGGEARGADSKVTPFPKERGGDGVLARSEATK
jgi:cytoskeletal protein CcmA (bactofilin family)